MGLVYSGTVPRVVDVDLVRERLIIGTLMKLRGRLEGSQRGVRSHCLHSLPCHASTSS